MHTNSEISLFQQAVCPCSGMVSKSDSRLLGPIPDAFGIGTWAMQGDQTSAASLLRWFHDQLAPDVSYADLDREAKQIPPGSEGLRALDT